MNFYDIYFKSFFSAVAGWSLPTSAATFFHQRTKIPTRNIRIPAHGLGDKSFPTDRTERLDEIVRIAPIDPGLPLLVPRFETESRGNYCGEEEQEV